MPEWQPSASAGMSAVPAEEAPEAQEAAASVTVQQLPAVPPEEVLPQGQAQETELVETVLPVVREVRAVA